MECRNSCSIVAMMLNSHRGTLARFSGEVEFILFIPINLACRNDVRRVSGGCVQVTLPYSCRMKRIESVGMVELVFVGRLLVINGDSLLMLVCGSVGAEFTSKGQSDVHVARAGTWWLGHSHGSRMSYHRNILLRTNGGRRRTNRKPIFVEGVGGGQVGSGWGKRKRQKV